MSHPDNEQNPWKSLAELLSRKTIVEALATAIEKNGIYTWDRFGRMIKAPKGDANDLYSQAEALNLLALVYKNSVEAQNDIDRGAGDEAMHDLELFMDEGDGPLVRFGWPLDECPDFTTYKPAHAVPKAVLQAGSPDGEGLLTTKERKSLYAIIRALMKMGKIQTDPLEPYKVAESIAPETSDENEEGGLHPNTIAYHLKRIYGLTGS